MLFSPRKMKYRKAFKGRNVGRATSGDTLAFGNYGVKILENVNLKNNTFEAAFKVINKTIKPYSKLWVRMFPHKPITKKPIEVRMGKGKGAVDHYVARVQAGKILMEFNGGTIEDMKKVVSQCSVKIGRKCKLVEREIGGVFNDSKFSSGSVNES